MKIITYYSIKANFDRTEGRGPTYHTLIGFTNYAAALQYVESEEYARNYGVMGMRGNDSYIEELNVKVYDFVHEMPHYNEAKIREVALAKLTDEELRVLGIARTKS